MYRTFRRLLVALLALACVSPSLARAEDLIPEKVLVRKFPEQQFCAMPITASFTAPAVPVIVTFTALQWVNESAGGLTWTRQLIDNVTIAPTAQVAANFAGPPVSGSSQNCYAGDPAPVEYFHFNRAGLTLSLLERFDSSAGPWDLAHGAYFTTTKSAPRDVETDSDLTGGALGLGDGTGTPVAGGTASSSITLSTLTAGQSYDLGAWWFAGHVHFPNDVTYMKVDVQTVDGTPVMRKTWGSLKQSYR